MGGGDAEPDDKVDAVGFGEVPIRHARVRRIEVPRTATEAVIQLAPAPIPREERPLAKRALEIVTWRLVRWEQRRPFVLVSCATRWSGALLATEGTLPAAQQSSDLAEPSDALFIL